MNEQIDNEVVVAVGELKNGRLHAHLRHGSFQARIESPVYGDDEGRAHAIGLLEMACEGAAMKRVYEVATGLVVPNLHVFDGEKMVLADHHAEMEADWDAFQAWSSANPIRWVVQQPEGFGFMGGKRLDGEAVGCFAGFQDEPG